MNRISLLAILILPILTWIGVGLWIILGNELSLWWTLAIPILYGVIGYTLAIADELRIDWFHPYTHRKEGRWNWQIMSILAWFWFFGVFAYITAVYERARDGKF